MQTQRQLANQAMLMSSKHFRYACDLQLREKNTIAKVNFN